MKTRVRLASLAAALAIVATACGGGASQAPTSAPGTTTPSSAPASEAPTALTGEITLWHSYASSGGGAESAEVQALNQIIKMVTDKNPGLKITSTFVTFDNNTIFTNFEKESATGGGPDMFIAPNDRLGLEARGGFFADLTGKIDDVLAASTDVAAGGSKVGDKVYMVPESLKAVAMYYDKAKVATPPKTTDDLLTWLKGGGKGGIIDGAYFGWGFYGAFGGKIFDDTGKCAATANSGVADAMKYVATLNKEKTAIVDSNYNKINDPFIAKNLDLIFTGNWALGDYKKARGSDLAVMPFLSGPGGQGKTLVGTDGWYINAAKDDAQQALAIAVAKQLVSAEAQQVMVEVAGHVPANKSVSVTDPLVKAFSDAFQVAGEPRPQSPEFDQYWGPFGDAWSKAVPDDDTAAPGDATALVADACTKMDTANKK
jgi:arabinogalactan oligomer/maltooligosaccharide transport system substrate-binding protein